MVCACFCNEYPAYCLMIPDTIPGEEGEDADLDAPKIYEPIPSLEALAEKLNGYMEQYNETIRGAKMDLVFFKVILIIESPKKNLLKLKHHERKKTKHQKNTNTSMKEHHKRKNTVKKEHYVVGTP